MSQPCTHISPQKICISPQCQLSSCLICQKCEQDHQHNGTISAVRITKLKQIYQNLLNKKNANKRKEQIVQYCIKVKEQFVKKIELWMEEKIGGKGDEGVVDVIGKLEGFLEGKGQGCFALVWEDVKKITNAMQDKKLEDKQINLSMLKKELMQIVGQENQQNKQSKQKPEGQSNSQFLQKFSSMFSYLSIELKSKPPISLISQLHQQQHHSHSKAHLKMITKLYELCEQPEAALKIYDQILLKNNLDIELIARKALLLKKCQKYQQSYDQFTLLIDLIKDKANVNVDSYRFHRAEICKQLGKLDEAIKQLETVGPAIRPWKVDKCLAQIKHKQQKHSQAIELYQKTLKSAQIQQSDKLQILQDIFQISKKTNNTVLALQSITNLISLDPNNLQYRFKRARLYHEQKNHHKAIEDYTVALEKVQNIPGLYYNRAVEYIYAGDGIQSIPDLKKAIQLDPNFKEAVHLLASTCFQLLFKKGNTPEVEVQLKNLAINSYGYCLNFYPKNQNIWHNLGVLETEKNPQKAYECFVKALQINPKLAASYLGKAKASIMLKRDPAETLKDVMILISLGDRTVPTFLLKCILEQQLGRYEQALETANLILKADPQSLQALNTKKRAEQNLLQLQQATPTSTPKQS